MISTRKNNDCFTAACLVVVGLLLPTFAKADSCSIYFPDSVQGHSSSSTIKFKDSGQIINDSDNVLAFANLDEDSSVNTCGTADCTISSSTSPALTLPTFEQTSASNDITITWETKTIGTGGDYSVTEIDELTVSSGNVTFLANSSKYLIKKGKFFGDGSITFNPGEYWFNELEITGNARVYINGPVTIYVNVHFDIENSVEVNNDAGSASKDLAIVGYEQIHLKGDVTVKAVLYGAGQDVHIHDSSKLIGAVSANGTVELKGTATITYEDISGLSVGTQCTGEPTVVDHYEITHDSVGSTCATESVTIKACANTDCSSLATGTTSLNFQGDGSTLSSPSFTGSTTFTYTHTSAETLTLSVDSPSVTPDNALVCDDGSGSSCDIVFLSAGCPVAGTCAAIFPDAVNNSDNAGYIKFEKSGQVIDNLDTILATQTVTHKSNVVVTTCVTVNCTASGSIVDTMTGSFTANTSSTNLTVDDETLTIATNDYGDVKVKDGGTLNMSSSFSTYTFAKLKVDEESTVNMTAGDYYIDNLEIKDESTLNVIGSGTVRIWAKTKAKFKESSVINGGSSGDASQLFIYYYADTDAGGDDKMKVESGTTIAAIMYSAGKVEVKGSSRVYGAITAEGELKIKDTATVTFKIAAIASADFGSACDSGSSGVDHYRYEYDGSALTCATETVTIKACANADCSSLYGSSTDLTFTASIPSATVSNSLSFTGSTAIILAESTPTTLTMSMSSPSPSATLYCYENEVLDANCNYSLSDTGFIFLNETDNNQIIPTQLSGKPSDTGYNSKTIVLQAVQTDTNTGACTALFPDETETPVDLAYQCVNPGTCSSNLASITNVNTDTNTTNSYNLSQYNTYGSHNLFFSSDSKAIITIKYLDAGQIKLYAKKSVTLLEGEVKLMTGNSNSFVVRPFGLSMTTTDNNPEATNNGGGIFHRAGESFDMTMSAVQWVSGEDTDNNGVPDSGANISNNALTPNFGQETVAVGVDVSHALVSPLTGDASTLTNSTFSGFSGGTKTQALSWNNVGIISLNAALSTGTYLGSDTMTTAIANLGRFVPNHFRLNASSINQTCGAFSYMGQTVNMTIDLEAQGVGDISLSNYNTATGTGADNHALATFGFVAENSDDGFNLGGRFGSLPADWVSGSVTAAFAPNFARDAAIDGPFDNVFVGLQVNDGEAGIVIDLFDNGVNGPDMNALAAGDCSVADDCDAFRLDAFGQVQPVEVSYRYGRLNSAQVFGPASQNLTLPLFTQAWNGSNFILSADDGCSTIAAANVLMASSQVTPFAANYNLLSLTDSSDVGDVQVDLAPANTTDTTLTAVAGAFNLTLGQSTEIVGYVPVTIRNLDAWLRFNWDEGVDGIGDTDLPTQNATFGQFRGNDRVIYWREKK
ncbi:MAG: hypothetical protein HRT35_17535 [Algicola sp.]|nr:hypothetical protein [Algicola sp.]